MRHRLMPVFAAIVASSLAAQSADGILAKHLQAMGGIDKLRAVHAIRLKGTLEAAPGVLLPLVIEEARPNKVRLEARSGDIVFVRLFDGVKGWSSDPSTGGVPRPLTAQELKAAMRSTFDGDLVDLPSRGARLDSLGRQLVQGREAYGLKVVEKDGSASLHWIDAKSFLEVQSEREMDTAQGRRTQMMRFSDFRIVEGMPMAFRVESGQKFSSKVEIIQISQVQLNPVIPDADFETPARR
jgi:hypothetical protein